MEIPMRMTGVLLNFGRFGLAVIIALMGVLTVSATLHAQENCSALESGVLQGASVKSATTQRPGRLSTPDGQQTGELPDFCRVIGSVKPPADSDIGFELWMPPAENWNHKLLVVGNGGYVGEIRYDELEPAIRRGYAVGSSDSGHTDQVEYRKESLKWGVGHPEKIADWAYRSIHAVADVSRVLVKRFEERDATHSYYFGCSTGGGQGLMAAQHYPDDFDGIIAGDPGFNRTGLNMGFLWMAARNLKAPDGYISPAKLPVINQAAIDACDKA